MAKQPCSDDLLQLCLRRRSGKGHESTNQNLLGSPRRGTGGWRGGIPCDRQHKEVQGRKYTPQINPAEFTTTITNEYFTLPVGKKLTYETTVQGRSPKGSRSKSCRRPCPSRVWRRWCIWTRNQKRAACGGNPGLPGATQKRRRVVLRRGRGQLLEWNFGEPLRQLPPWQRRRKSRHLDEGRAARRRLLPAGILRWPRGRHPEHGRHRETVSTKSGTYTGCVKVYDWTRWKRTRDINTTALRSVRWS